MPEENKDPVVPEVKPTDEDPTGGPKDPVVEGKQPKDPPKGDDDDDKKTVPLSKFNQQTARAKSAEEELAKLKGEKETAEKARLKKEGKVQELLEKSELENTELKSKVGKLENIEGTLKSFFEKETDKMKDDGKKMLESLPESMTVQDKLDFVNNNRDQFYGTQAPNQNLPSNPDGTPLGEKEKLVARRDELREKHKSESYLNEMDSNELGSLSMKISAIERRDNV